MPKGKKKLDNSTKSDIKSDVKSASDVFKMGMQLENTIEFIESKLLDAFFGHIGRQSDWDLAKQYILNVQEWAESLFLMAKLELGFLPSDLQDKIIKTSENLESGIKSLLKAINKKDFDDSNNILETILKEIRALYRIRE